MSFTGRIGAFLYQILIKKQVLFFISLSRILFSNWKQVMSWRRPSRLKISGVKNDTTFRLRGWNYTKNYTNQTIPINLRVVNKNDWFYMTFGLGGAGSISDKKTWTSCLKNSDYFRPNFGPQRLTSANILVCQSWFQFLDISLS